MNWICTSQGAAYCRGWEVQLVGGADLLAFGSGLVVLAGVVGWGFGWLVRLIRGIRV